MVQHSYNDFMIVNLICLRVCKGEDYAFYQRGVGREAASLHEKVVNEGIDRYSKMDHMSRMCMHVFFWYVVRIAWADANAAKTIPGQFQIYMYEYSNK